MRCRKTNAGRLGIGQHRNAFRTECEINADNEIKEESALHDKVIAFCNRNALGYVHSRMDKRPTIRKGWPDCTVCRRHMMAARLLRSSNLKPRAVA
jgi:hypothetical protein